MIRKKTAVALLLGLLCQASQAQESHLSQSFELVATEAAALQRIANEIERLLPLVREAESVADPSRRLQVNYAWLRKDLNAIRHGLEDAAFGAGDITPRPVDRLRGAYTN